MEKKNQNKQQDNNKTKYPIQYPTEPSAQELVEYCMHSVEDPTKIKAWAPGMNFIKGLINIKLMIRDISQSNELINFYEGNMDESIIPPVKPKPMNQWLEEEYGFIKPSPLEEDIIKYQYLINLIKEASLIQQIREYSTTHSTDEILSNEDLVTKSTKKAVEKHFSKMKYEYQESLTRYQDAVLKVAINYPEERRFERELTRYEKSIIKYNEIKDKLRSLVTKYFVPAVLNMEDILQSWINNDFRTCINNIANLICSGTSFFQYTLTNVLRNTNYLADYDLAIFLLAIDIFWDLIEEYGLKETEDGKLITLIGMFKRNPTKVTYDLDFTLKMEFNYNQTCESLIKSYRERKATFIAKPPKVKESVSSAQVKGTKLKDDQNGCKICEQRYGNPYRHKGPHDYDKDKKPVKEAAKVSEPETASKANTSDPSWDKVMKFFSDQEQKMNQLASNMASLQRSWEDERALNLAAERLKEKQAK
jgi:hypothetical protein